MKNWCHPLSLRGESSVIAFDNFCTKTLLCSEDFCDCGAKVADASPFKKVLSKAKTPKFAWRPALLHVVIHVSREAPRSQFQLLAYFFDDSQITYSSHFPIKNDFWSLCWQQYYDFLLGHQAENTAFHNSGQLSSINTEQWRREESRESSSTWLTYKLYFKG